MHTLLSFVLFLLTGLNYLQSAGNNFFGRVVSGDLQDQIPAHGCDWALLKSTATTKSDAELLTGMMLSTLAPSGATLDW